MDVFASSWSRGVWSFSWSCLTFRISFFYLFIFMVLPMPCHAFPRLTSSCWTTKKSHLSDVRVQAVQRQPDFRCVLTCWWSMEFNGHAAAASLGGDIIVSSYLKTDFSDPSPQNEEGLPSAFLSSLPPPPPFLSHPLLTSPSFTLLSHTSKISSFYTFCDQAKLILVCQTRTTKSCHLFSLQN